MQKYEVTNAKKDCDISGYNDIYHNDSSSTSSRSWSFGRIRISCDTNSTTRADEIGVKDVVLQEKVNGVWKNINIAGGSEKDSYDYVGSVVYTNAVKGRSYRAHCTHYAKYGSTTKTVYGEVGPIVYN